MPLIAPLTSFVAIDRVDVVVLDLDQHAPELIDGSVRCVPLREPAPPPHAERWRTPPDERGQSREARL